MNRGRLASMALLVAAALAAVAQAETGNVTTLPANGFAPCGLRIIVDARGIDAPGYRPVRVTVERAQPDPQPGERRVRILFDRRWFDREGSHAMSNGDLVLPAGAPSAKADLLVPLQSISATLAWTVVVDGQPAKELAGYDTVSANINDIERRLLLVDTFAKLEDLDPMELDGLERILHARRPGPPGDPTGQSGSFLISPPSGGYRNCQLLDGKLLPSDWRGYSTYDVALLPLDTLKQLTPAQRAALRQAVFGGIDLVISGVGPQFPGQASVEKLLELTPSRERQRTEISGIAWRTYAEDLDARGQVEAEPDGTRVERENQSQFAIFDPREVPADSPLLPPSDPLSPLPPGEPPPGPDGTRMVRLEPLYPIDQENRLRIGSLGVGRVILASSRNPLYTADPETRDPNYLRNVVGGFTIGPDEWEGVVEHGSFPIPGVGEPPTTVFYLLISLFVIVIGPVNYFLLLRMGRLWMLLVTVPAAASLVIAGLFAYAFIVDGLTNRVRVQSLTYLDQPRGLAVTVARQTYFSGMPPRDGLAFPADTLLLPAFEVRREVLEYGEITLAPVTMHHLEADGQRLGAGFLPARTMFRLLQKRVQAGVTDRGVLVRAPAGGSLAVVNRLGVPIETIVVCDAAGVFHQGGAIPTAGEGALVAGGPLHGFTRTSRYGAQPLVDLVSGASPGYQPDHQLGEHSMIDFAFNNGEFFIQHGLFRGPPLKLEPGTYLVILEQNPFVPLGAEGLEEQASVHVLVGRWRP